jgi:4-amino-4-deoxy-L-arabinose transferase-like glycosyltransferase
VIPKFFKKHWLILTILILAAFLRLYHIQDYMEFLGDQGRDVVIVRNFLKNGDLFFIGPQTSIGNMYLGPYYYYLFVVPGLLLSWFNPTGPAIVVALLGVVTVFLIYLFSKEWFGPKTAYIASFLYAISPVVIKYSSFSWNPNVMPLFSLLFVYFLLKSRYVLASLAFIICLNSHFLALLLLPLGFIVWIYQYLKDSKARPIKIKQTIIAVLIFLVSLTPQILFDIKHNGQNVKAILSFFTYRETTVNLKPYKAIPLLAPLFDQVNTRLLAGKNDQFGLFITTIFTILIIFELYRQIRSKKTQPNLNFMILWLLFGLSGLALYKQHIYDHYFGFIYPVVFILFSYLLAKLPKLVFFPIFIALLIFSLLENPFRWPAPKQLATTRSITDSVVSSSKGDPFNFSLLAKMNYDPGYRYLLAESNAPVKLLNEQVTDQLFVVCEPFQIECNPINNPEWSVAAFGWAKIDSQWEINGIKIFRLVHNPNGQSQN